MKFARNVLVTLSLALAFSFAACVNKGDIDEIKKKTRRANIAMARQVAMYIMRTNVGLSFPSIGRHFGLDHTTVIHGCNKISFKRFI